MPAPAILERVPLFEGLAGAPLDALAGHLRRRRYAKGEVVFLRGDPGTNLCIVEEGGVKIVLTSAEGKEVVLAHLGAGDFFGELALLDGKPRSADAVALEPTTLLLLARDDFLRFVQERPAVAPALLAVLAQRLREDVLLVQDAAFLDVPARLARAVFRLIEARQGAAGLAPGAAIRVTQGELASLAGATRESVNKWIGFYERQGVLRHAGGRLTVLDPQKLQARIG
jgi:CRP-like cAMP-binding protein